MSNEIYRKYINIINEYSNELSPELRDYIPHLIRNLGLFRRHELATLYQYCKDPETYKKNPEELKKMIKRISNELTKLLTPLDRKSVLAGGMDEYRIINGYEQVLMGDISDLYQLVDKKNIEELTRIIHTVENSLIDLTKSMYKRLRGVDMGSNIESFIKR